MKRVELWIMAILLCIFIVLIVMSGNFTVDREQEEDSRQNEIESSYESLAENQSGDPAGHIDMSNFESSSVSMQESSKESDSSFQTADLSYLDDAVFIGDSRTQGLQLGTGLTTPRFLAERGMSIDKMGEEALYELATGELGTAYDVLGERTYGKAYVMFGINEIGWPYPEIFIEDYRNLLQKMKTIQPDMTIYVQGIIPVSAEKDAEGDVFTNEKIRQRNQMIEQLANEEGCIYLSPGDALIGEDGALKPDASSDGIHLTAQYCELWLEYLLQHTVD